MKNKINLALEILPQSETTHPYKIVDKTIEVIQKSCLKYKNPLPEPVIEGHWDELLLFVKKIHKTYYPTMN